MLGGVLRSRVEVREQQATPWGVWQGESTGRTWAGENVTADSAMQLLAVYGSVGLITDQISTLPVDVFRHVGEMSVESPKPAWLIEPTVDLGFEDWCSQLLVSLLLSGNAFVAVNRNQSNAIVELVPLDPARVTVAREDGRKVYRVNGINYPGEMVHIKGRMWPGSDVGLSPVEYARQSIGLGLSALKFGGEFFDGEGNMPGVIEMPRPAQPGIMAETARTWRRRRQQGGRGMPGVLQDGATWKPTGVTNEQAQFLATRQWSAAEIAGQVFFLDPSDLGIPVDGTSLTYANLEQRNARRLQVALLPWIVRIERAVSALLYNPRYMKFNVNGFLRGDLKTRYEAYAIGITNGFVEPNEAREREDMPPLDAPLPVPEESNVGF